MGNPWDADIQLTEHAATRLIAEQFPEVAPVQAVVLGVGWDNLALLVNARWVFRFPGRQVAGDLLAREVRILPLLAPYLPLPIPVPAFVGTSTGAHPYIFAGYALLPGRTACHVPLFDRERGACARARRLSCSPARHPHCRRDAGLGALR
jgi:aminoglycoside phosphotransferase (APT) family kinase protein